MKLSKVFKHIVFWVLFLLLWSVHDLNYHENVLENLENNLFTFIPYAVLVYFNLYFLMPKLLLKRRIGYYVIFLLFGIIIITFFSSFYLSFYFKYINEYLPTSSFFKSIAGKIAIATEVILSLCLSMILFLIDEWYQKDRSIRTIEEKHLETELKLLKNQINPHFLFNALNSIYIMLGKNLEDGKKMFLQFSEILSHQLYESSKKNILLKHEFDNLNNYIAIERIRHEDLVTVDCSFPAETHNLAIAPMLLLPLVENAFKHGQSSSGYQISIDVSIESGCILNFKIENTFSNQNTSISNKVNKGIGLKNVNRRLELIYPDKHSFKIERKNTKFIVYLKIQLYENEVFNS